MSACGSFMLLIREDSQHICPAEAVPRAGGGSPGTGANLALIFLLLHASNDLFFYYLHVVFNILYTNYTWKIIHKINYIDRIYIYLKYPKEELCQPSAQTMGLR